MRKVTVKWLAGKRIEVIKETPKTDQFDFAHQFTYTDERVLFWLDGVEYTCVKECLSTNRKMVRMYTNARPAGDMMQGRIANFESKEGSFERYWMTRFVALNSVVDAEGRSRSRPTSSPDHKSESRI